MPNVSIIVPVYNRASSIRFCLESIDAMQYRDFEVIVVDDGSSDDSPQICRNFCESHSLFHYIRQDNRGVSNARNHGIRKARGKWITFVDSDDAVAPEHLNIVEMEKGNNADWIIESFKLIGTVKRKVQMPSVIDETFRTRVETEEPVKYIFTDMQKTDTPMFSTWGKFFKLSICKEHKILFNERFSFGEDQYFVSTYARYVKKMVHYPDVRTYLLLDWGDIHLSGKLHTPEDYMDVLESNYKAFITLGGNDNQACAAFAEQFMLTRSIRLIILLYTRRKNSHLYPTKELYNFIQERIYPYYINFKHPITNIAFPYMCTYQLIKHNHIKFAIYFCQLYNLHKSIIFKIKIGK